MSTKEALEAYDNCSAKIFSSKNRKSSLSERFRATALQKVVEGIVKQQGLGERMWEDVVPEKGKVMVCVMPADDIGNPQFVRSFPGDFATDEQWDRDITIWEAARATTAASSFFKPQVLGTGSKAREYIDAAIGNNNPLEHLLKEAVNELGSGKRLGCIVSIGTGTRDLKLERALTGVRNWFGAPSYYKDLLRTLKNMATSGEDTHQQLYDRFLPFPGSYYRFNVPSAAEEVELHKYQKLSTLKSLTASYLDKEDVAKQIRQLAGALSSDQFDHGLTLGHICMPGTSSVFLSPMVYRHANQKTDQLDKDQIFLANTTAHSMGSSSYFFTGRQDILERLDSFFCPRGTGRKPRREFLLHGMGGVGKTEIALRVAEELEDRYRTLHMPATPYTDCT